MILMLQVEDIHFNYGKNQILKNISFDVEEGLLCGLFGPNGCGKTTLFKCCMKFLKFHKGSVIMDGIDIKKHRIEDMAKVVAYVPQEHKPPFPYLVKEVVLMGRTPHLGGFFGVKRADKEKALNALELLDISHLGEQPYNQLSGGQRQMVLIARAIAQETKLIFLDEPTSALDFSNQMRIWTLLRKVAEQGITILACSHDPNHVTWFCDKVVVMNNNGIISQGAPNHVITETILDEIYQNMCTVRSLDNVKMILPRDVAVKKRLDTKTDARAPN